MSEEIKPCPFCGRIGLDFKEGSTFRWIIAECGECGASRGETRIQTMGQGTKEEWMAQAEADAIEHWNIRAAQLVASEPSSGERGELIRLLREDAEHHREVANDCDCRPEDTVNWQHALRCEQAAALLSSDAKPASEQDNLLRVEVAGLSSANCHLSDLVDDLRQIVSDAMASMKAIEDVAKPQDESHGDFDCIIPYESWSKFVDARASLLYRIEHSPHELPPASEPVAVPQGWKLAPVEPTQEMLKAGEIPTREIDLGNGTTTLGLGLGASAHSIYRAMLSAAPSPAPVGIKKENHDI